MVPRSPQPPPGPTAPQARDRRPLASSPGGGRHSGPKARGRRIAVHADGSPLGATSTRPHGTTGKGTPTSGRHSGPKARGDASPFTQMVPLSAQPPPSPTVPQARERRPPVGTAGRRPAGDASPFTQMVPLSARPPPGPHRATGKGTPTSGQFSRWGPAPRAEGPRATHRRSRRWFPSRRSLHQAPRCHRQGNADLRAAPVFS